MKIILKIVFAFALASAWYILSGEGSEAISVVFFFLIVFAFFIKPQKIQRSALREKYLEKLKENKKRSQEVNKELNQEQRTVYRDLRRRKE
ncbi:hypothetical protein CQA62_02920 [Helicobacter cholecystus]|uniref:Uncharacterized protein n=1 Tax=Helicobacter cholecystus TaxID=45498 RepID=A0A3D8IXH3_9HELI|nr:hypothetical protein [Helicobacter cholecystus]RDU69615.1 hypothetical protein CQA62_02920 [Helicobacter cholecystus]VEJ24174.1 integral membrane protein [Helicobacter cholecystus]